MKSNSMSLNQLLGNIRGIEVMICASIGKTFIFNISALPHRDLDRALHLMIPFLMDWRVLGPFRLKILVMREIMVMPKNFIPFVFQKKGASFKSDLNV